VRLPSMGRLVAGRGGAGRGVQVQGARVARHGGGVLPLPLRWHRVAGGALDRSACPRVRARTAAVPV